MKGIFLGLGSNLGEREGYLARARELLQERGVEIVGQSTVLETKPLGGLDQPDYLNQVLEVHTELEPEALLGVCKAVEEEMGRVRGERWASRIIDIDILLYGERRVDEPGLVIPHPGLSGRDFVVAGLAELGANGIA